MRKSCRAIIFKEDEIALIYRESKHGKYYVFPGGGIEDFETKEDCVIRECKEELGINVIPKKEVYEIHSDEIFQNIFLCEWIDGEFNTGEALEFKDKSNGIYRPLFIKIDELNNLNVISPFLVSQLLKDYQKFGKDLNNEMSVINEMEN